MGVVGGNFKVIKPWVVDKQAGLPKKDLTHLNKIGYKLFPKKSQIFKVRKPKILPFKNTINKASRDIPWVVDKQAGLQLLPAQPPPKLNQILEQNRL